MARARREREHLSAHDDQMYKFKKNMSLTKKYEIYLEAEKSQQRYARELFERTDPMAILTRKIRRDEYLQRADLRAWTRHNHLVFSEEEQAQVRKLAER